MRPSELIIDLPQLLLRPERREGRLVDHVVDEGRNASQPDVARLAELTRVRDAAVEFFGVLVAFAEDVV